MASDVTDPTSDDTRKSWKTLERMPDTPPAPFAKSSVWARFDYLCALVRNLGLSKDNTRIVEKSQPHLDTIEKIDHMRDGRDEGTGDEYNQSSSDAYRTGKHGSLVSSVSDCARYQGE